MNAANNLPDEIIFIIKSAPEEEVREAVQMLAENGIPASVRRAGETAAPEAKPQTAQAAVQAAALETEPESVPAAKQESAPNTGTLYLTDSAEVFRSLSDAGFAVVGYLHANNADESFPGADYLISEPHYVDPDSYVKIWQRLTHRPWTILETERLVIREMTAADLEENAALYKDEEASRFLTPPLADLQKEREKLEAYIDKVYGLYGYGSWAVILKENGRMIGRAGFEPYQAGQDRLRMGYLIGAEYRRQGYALEACSALVCYAVQALGFPGVCAITSPENAASKALLIKLGFTPDGSEETPEGVFDRYIVGEPIRE